MEARQAIKIYYAVERMLLCYLRNKMISKPTYQLKFHEAANLRGASIPRAAAERVKTGSNCCSVGGMTGPAPQDQIPLDS
jgi:hypothetical protein